MRTSKRKLAFIPNPLDSTLKSSIGIVTYELATRLSDDYDIYIYTSKGNGPAAPSLPHGLNFRRLAVSPDKLLRRFTGKVLPYTLRNPFFSSPLYYPGYMLQIAFDLKKTGCEIVHLHNFTQFIPVIRAVNPGIKIVLHMHSEWLTQLDRAMIKKRASRLDMIVSCSDYITKKTVSAFPDLSRICRTLHNGVDSGKFNASFNGSEPSKKLICVGRITPEKGLHVVLEAFRELAFEFPGLEIRFIGQERITPSEFLVDISDDEWVKPLKSFYPGSYQKRLMEMVAPELEGMVSFTGQVSHSEMAGFYSDAGIFINASLYESFGIPVAEAMACGVPVIASRVGGVPEIIEDGKSGLLVEPGDAGSLKRAIVRLLTNNSLRVSLAKAGKERVSELFNWDRLALTLDGYYKELLETSAAPASRGPTSCTKKAGRRL